MPLLVQFLNLPLLGLALLAGSWRPSKAPSLFLGPGEPGVDTLADHGALELCEDTHHLEQGLSSWRGGIDPLTVQVQINASGL